MKTWLLNTVLGIGLEPHEILCIIVYISSKIGLPYAYWWVYYCTWCKCIHKNTVCSVINLDIWFSYDNCLTS